ncbi:Translation elongation factor EF-1 gamma [Phaffia rhodozyma]|uniref:Translation elongation factor EF-1 gamma n=1 Tax=Phaffia rhodozyma TaxID=264483 RepID=A0A0F7SRQ0_PHARH|nr:Translation elongation factor EF-1 gamma [Phaffia rhodozyma]
MSDGTLFSFVNPSFKVRRILATAAFAGLDLNRTTLESGEQKAEAYLQKFPFGKIPALEQGDFKLTEGTAIAYYLARSAPNSGLIPSDPKEAALIDQWVSFAETEINERISVATGMINNFIPYNKPVFQSRIEKVTAALTFLDNYLSTRTFLVGERITLADITVASVLADAFSRHYGAEDQKKFSNAVRFEQTVINHPKIASIFSDVSLATEAATYVAPKKEAAPKAPKAPKAEAAPKAPKAKEVDEEEEESFADKPAGKNPLDALPKSTFNLEEWKRVYSNEDTRTGAIPWFYNNVDKEGFSVWKIDFKYNTELTQTFMSSNQIGGLFARFEGSRKYLFGSVGVLGKANDSIITGTLILRGQDVVPVVSVAPDWESYEFTRLDLENEADKTFFEGALAWDLKIGDKEWVDGKNFK